MTTNTVNYSLSTKNQFVDNEFDDDFYNHRLKYSLRHLAFLGNISNEKMEDALNKCLQICYLANINSKQHFKRVYLYNEQANMLQVDFFMSKNGFNLILMQMPTINEKLACWLWRLSEL